MRKLIKFNSEEQEKIIQFYTDGLSCKNIGKKIGVSETIIWKKLNKWGIDTSKKAHVKRFRADKKNAIKMYEQMNSISKLVEYYGVSRVTIWHYLNRWGIDTSDVRVYKIDDDFFATIDTEEKAYWLGFISADAWVYEDGIQLNLQVSDRKHLEKMLKSMRSNYKIYDRGRYFCVQIRSKKMASDLFSLGVVNNKTYILKPCNRIPKHLIAHYWRGIVEGDGSLGFTKGGLVGYIQLTGTYDICNGFKNFTQDYLPNNNKVGSKANSFQFSITGKRAVPVINALYYGGNIYLDRKYKKACKILEYYE